MSVEQEITAAVDARIAPLRDELERLRGEWAARKDDARENELVALREVIARIESQIAALREAAEAARQAATESREEEREEEREEDSSGVTLIESPPVPLEPETDEPRRRRSFFSL